MSVKSRGRRPVPLWVRVCVYLAFGLGLSPLVLSTWEGRPWDTELRQAIIPTLFVGGCAELFRWLNRERA
ncbi:hypothetical protein GCM10029978_119130 [Actinoallomurus acanthiterrae]